MSRKLLLATTSRYRETSLFSSRAEKKDPRIAEDTFFGTFVSPEIRLTNQDAFITIQNKDNGRLDLMATEFYGDPRLWWVIALANNIVDPTYGVEVGTVIRIPRPENVFKSQLETF